VNNAVLESSCKDRPSSEVREPENNMSESEKLYLIIVINEAKFDVVLTTWERVDADASFPTIRTKLIYDQYIKYPPITDMHINYIDFFKF